jgi:RNAse (barnase) inhibitor barstar
VILIFDEVPHGIQVAPHDPRVIAAGYQVAVREVNFGGAHDKASVMQAFHAGLGLSQAFGRNWDALYDVLSDPEVWPAKLAVMLCDYEHFRARHARLAGELEDVLLDAQAEAARQQRRLWLLTSQPDSDAQFQ